MVKQEEERRRKRKGGKKERRREREPHDMNVFNVQKFEGGIFIMRGVFIS